MSYIILTDDWCHITVLIVHAAAEDNDDDRKDTVYEELEGLFEKFPKCHMKILLGDLNDKIGSEGIYTPTIWNKSLRDIRNDSGIKVYMTSVIITELKVANFATSKNLTDKSTVLPHGNIHKYTWKSPDRKRHNQCDHILTDRQRLSSVLDARIFRAADRDTEHYLVVAKIRERLKGNKQ
jgi:hypothetical protein